MKGVYHLTVSGIDENGYQYISGMLVSRNGFTLTAFVSEKRSVSRFTTTKTNRRFGRSSGSEECRATGRT